MSEIISGAALEDELAPGGYLPALQAENCAGFKLRKISAESKYDFDWRKNPKSSRQRIRASVYSFGQLDFEFVFVAWLHRVRQSRGFCGPITVR